MEKNNMKASNIFVKIDSIFYIERIKGQIK